MSANPEKPFDGHCYGCLQQLLFYYDISKTIVFWTNVFLILFTAITGNFGRLCFAITEHIEMSVRLICSMFRVKPSLDTRHFLDDTMTMRQQRYRKNNLIEKFAWLKRKMIEKETQNEQNRRTIQDILADTLDFVLNTRSRHQQRDCGYRQEAGSMPCTKLSTKNLRSFRKLNTSAIDLEELETSTQQFICRKCSLQIIRNSSIVKKTI